MSHIPDPPNLTDMLRRYVTGESENRLAQELQISRSTFRTRLLRNGIQPRSQSESESAKWSRMTARQRRRQVKAAHDAIRGKPISRARALANAIGRERIAKISSLEKQLIKLLPLKIVPQKAFGPYNLDIAIEEFSIAVELFGGGWHNYGRHKARFEKRLKYLLDRGWSVLFIWVDKRKYPVTPVTAEQIIAFVEHCRRNPAPLGQYRMIRADGKVPPPSFNFNKSPAELCSVG
jgi:very-short-patch-repair endonuclease